MRVGNYKGNYPSTQNQLTCAETSTKWLVSDHYITITNHDWVDISVYPHLNGNITITSQVLSMCVQNIAQNF